MVIFFLEWLEMDVIRSAKDIERAIDVTVLGVIPPVSGNSPSPVDDKQGQLVPNLRGTN